MSAKPRYAVVVEKDFPEMTVAAGWRVIEPGTTLLAAVSGFGTGMLVILLASNVAPKSRSEDKILEALGITIVRVSDPKTLVSIDDTLRRWSDADAE